MVKPDSQSGRKPDEHSDDGTEQRILDAADEVFVRRGTDGARMQEIADVAGVNKSLLHYYYRTKELLSEAVFRKAASRFLPEVVQIMASELELEEKIDRAVDTYLTQLSRRPYLPGYIIGELTHHPDRMLTIFTALAGNRIQRLVLKKISAQIDARLEAGTIAPITAQQFLMNVISTCVFPFAARPMVIVLFEFGPRGFDRFIEQRRKELPMFLKRALRP
ncbi:MAG: TetR/AcrR family transcriptional regulator [Acidobacteriota bacterium]